MGIPLDEWDDAIHVKNDAFVPYGEVRLLEEPDECGGPADEGICHSHWALAEREEHEKRWDYAHCRALLTCVRDTVGGGWVKMADGWAQTVRFILSAHDQVSQHETPQGSAQIGTFRVNRSPAFSWGPKLVLSVRVRGF